MNIRYLNPRDSIHLGMWLVVKDKGNGNWVGIETCLNWEEAYGILVLFTKHDRQYGYPCTYAIISNPKREPGVNDWVWLKPATDLYAFIKRKKYVTICR